MMYPYLTLSDGTEVVHSELLDDEQGGRVLVHFERPSVDGFDSVRFMLPSYDMEIWEGEYSEEELRSLRGFLEANAHLLFRYAAEGAHGYRVGKSREDNGCMVQVLLCGDSGLHMLMAAVGVQA